MVLTILMILITVLAFIAVIFILVPIFKSIKLTGNSSNPIDSSDLNNSTRSGMLKAAKTILRIVAIVCVLIFVYFVLQIFLSPRAMVHDPQTSSIKLQPISQNVYVYRYKVWNKPKHGSSYYDHHVKIVYNGETHNLFLSDCTVNYQSKNEAPCVTIKKYAYSNPVLDALFPSYESYDIYANESQIYNSDNKDSSGSGAY